MQREPLDQIFDFFHDWPFLGSILGKILKFSKILPKIDPKMANNEKRENLKIRSSMHPLGLTANFQIN